MDSQGWNKTIQASGIIIGIILSSYLITLGISKHMELWRVLAASTAPTVLYCAKLYCNWKGIE